MKRKLFLFSLLLLSWGVLFSQTYNGRSYRKKVAPTKNVIVMIPDGTSIGVVSAARWYQVFNKLGENLTIDSYLCGTALLPGLRNGNVPPRTQGERTRRRRIFL